jgi:hypothetical protein
MHQCHQRSNEIERKLLLVPAIDVENQVVLILFQHHLLFFRDRIIGSNPGLQHRMRNYTAQAKAALKGG